jgi:hypothetical protein
MPYIATLYIAELDILVQEKVDDVFARLLEEMAALELNKSIEA